MKAKEYMNNNINDPYHVFVCAKRNYVNSWTTTTLENAKKSIQLFFKETKLPRDKAIIKDSDWNTLEEIKNETK